MVVPRTYGCVQENSKRDAWLLASGYAKANDSCEASATTIPQEVSGANDNENSGEVECVFAIKVSLMLLGIATCLQCMTNVTLPTFC